MNPKNTDVDTPLSVGFINLGCAKNLVDSQVMAGGLISEGIALAPSPEEADVILVNTCSFIQDARDESYDAIEGACALKKSGPCQRVVVAGCLPQRYATELFEHHPDVDAIVGLDELESVADIVRQVMRQKDRVAAVSDVPQRTFEPRVPGLVFTGGPYAYLKIAEGCDHACAFCAIPGIRGHHRSRSIPDILSEATELLSSGYRELNIISQDVTSYGRDRSDGASLPLLLKELDALGHGFWVRLLYGYPSHLSDDLLSTMAELPSLCAYLDIPVQHSHPDILTAMRRGGTVDAVQTMTTRIRDRLPHAAIRTTCLVGFPGETEAHFKHLLDYVAASGFDHLGAFVFSPEDGTPAAEMPRTPPEADAENRRHRLLVAQQQVVEARTRPLVGQTADLLVEGRATGSPAANWYGRTPRFAPEVDGCVWLQDAPDDIEVGDMVTVRYTGRRDYDMVADVVTM